MFSLRRALFPAVLVLAGAVLPVAGGPATHPPITDPADVKEVDFSGLSEAQKKLALKVMNSQECNCGCGMKVAECRLRDTSCRRSLIFARTIMDAIREGKNEAAVIEAYKAKASTFVEAKLPDDRGVVHAIETAGSPVRGRAEAPITIVEFSDFQCPYCKELQATIDQVLKAFPQDVRLVFKQYPLNIHQYARQASTASLAAHAQGKFWPMHDKLFQNFSAINEENIKTWAREVGLNMGQFEKDMQSGRYEAAVQKDLADGAAAKVLGTPTLFVNGRRLQERSFEAFKKAIQEELAALKTGGAKAAGAAPKPAPFPAKPATAKPSGTR
jgi:protein-disulfide isomerase